MSRAGQPLPADPIGHDVFAWQGRDLAPDAGVVRVEAECIEEIMDLARELEANPLPIEALAVDDFELPACRRMMRRAHTLVEHELGFALIDRLPLDRLQKETAVKVYWLLASMVSRPVAQNWKGALVYAVADVTKKRPGNGIRPDVTSAEQNFHTDNSYNVTPPDFVALLCMQTAKSGGISRIVSFEAARRRLEERGADLVQRLYQPFLFDRQREHAPGDEKWIENPIFSNTGGRLNVRLSAYLVRQGYELAGKTVDPVGEDALNALSQIIDDPAMYKEFYFEPGQIQIVDNRRIGHKRTAFEDWPEPERQRHLVRLWLRDRGRRFYHG
ncbi:MAG: TauD/TfdA family dioxygenase [Hyphomicrobiaceae bacterium]